MGDLPRPRVAFITGSLDFSGMIAAAILEEAVQPVGVVYDAGEPAPEPAAATAAAASSSASQPSSTNNPPIPKWKQLYMHGRLAMVMPGPYAAAVLRRIGVSWLDTYRRLNRKDPERYPMLDELARREGIPFHRVDCTNSPEAERLLSAMNPDIVVGLGTRIIKPNILDIPRLGVLNGHSSLLPDYRGSTTEFWQLVHGETRTGVTIHWMRARVDEGEILAQDEWPIEPGATHHQLRLQSQFKRLDTWRRAIRSVIAAERGRPQGIACTPKFRRPTLQDQYNFYIRRQTRSLDPPRD